MLEFYLWMAFVLVAVIILSFILATRIIKKQNQSETTSVDDFFEDDDLSITLLNSTGIIKESDFK